MKTPQDVLDQIHNAKCLPADEVVYRIGAMKVKHSPATDLQCEQVQVMAYGVLWRSLKPNAKRNWTRPEPVSGVLSA